MAEVGIRELLESGVHFGHQTRRWNPKMRRFIHGERGGIYIIDLLKTQALLEQAQQFSSEVAHRGGTVLFVGTKKQARDSIKEVAENAGMPFVNHRWLGGLLTNFQTISLRIKRLHDLERYETEGQLALLPTRERMAAQADLAKLQANLGGVKNMQRPPDAMFVVDLKTEVIAVQEAKRLRIPIIGLVDTNCDPDGIDYVIPGNDDAIKSCAIITQAIGDVVSQGYQTFRAEEERARKEAEEQARKEAEERAAREEEERQRKEAEEAAARQAERDAAAAAEAQRAGCAAEAAPAARPLRAAKAAAGRAGRGRSGRQGGSGAGRGRSGRRRGQDHHHRVRQGRGRGRGRRRRRGRAAAGRGHGRRRGRRGRPGRDRGGRPGRVVAARGHPAPGGGHGEAQEARAQAAREEGRTEDRREDPGEGMSTPTITASQVKELRDKTGAGMMDCKAALTETGGDIDAAVELLRVRLGDKALKMGGREATEGTVQAYIHTNGKTGVLVEVDCNTDFVARNDDFIAFARDVALHVAASPQVQYVSEDEIPEDAKQAELRVFEQQAADKPENVRAKIAEGKLRKWMEEVVLLNQEHVNGDKHDGKTIEQIRAELSGTTGENVVIRRFSKFVVGA